MDSVLNGINKSSIFSCACVLAHELMNHSMKIHFWHETEYFGQWPKFTQKQIFFFWNICDSDVWLTFQNQNDEKSLENVSMHSNVHVDYGWLGESGGLSSKHPQSSGSITYSVRWLTGQKTRRIQRSTL